MLQEFVTQPQTVPEDQSLRPSKEHSSSTGKWVFSVALITFLALFLRVFAVDYHSFWYDEAVTAILTQVSLTDLVQGREKDNGNPPLYWVAARGWSILFGRSEIGLRSLSVVCGVLTIPILALLGRRLLDRTTGLFAAGLLAISPFHIELSNEARTYALLGFLIVLNSYFFVRWIDQMRITDLAVYALTTFLSCYSHYYALILPLGNLACLLTFSRTRGLLFPWLGAMAVAGLLWICWLPAFIEQLRTPGNLSREADRWQYQFLSTPVVFSLGRTFAWRDSTWWMLGLAALGTLVAFAGPTLLALFQLRRQRLTAIFLGGWCLLPIFCPLIVAVFFSPIYHVRAASVGFLAYILLLAFGLTQIRLPLRIGMIGLIIVLTGISLFRYATQPLKDDWRSATPYILNTVGNGEPIIFDKDIEVVSFKYYVPSLRSLPEKMIAVVSAEQGHILGVQYQNGTRIDRAVRAYGEEIFSLPSGCLVLCVPSQPPNYYEDLLMKHGYTIARRNHFHRIDILHFVRNSGEEAVP